MTTRVRLALIVAVGIALAFGSLALSSVLPRQTIGRHIAADARILIQEPRERAWMGVEHMTDPYTDALIMNTTMIDPENAALATFEGRNFAGTTGDARESLATRAENGIASNDRYGRFWHGYAGPLRVVFTFLTYTQWRTLNAVLLWVGLAVLTLLTWRRLGVAAAVIILAVSGLSAPPLIAMSLQFTPVAHLAIWGSVVGLWLIHDREARAFDLELFLGIGMATAFFDLFTAPLLTLGLPLAILLAYRVSNRTRASEPTGLTKWELTGRAAGSWLLGYGALWAAKWVYMVLSVDRRTLVDVAESAAGWLGPGAGIVDRWTAMATNFEYLVPASWWPTDVSGTLAPIVVALIVATVVALWIALGRLVGVKRGSVPQALPLVAVAITPMLWLMVVVRHAADMAFMEYRHLLVTVAASAFFFLYTVDWSELGRKVRSALAPVETTPPSAE